MAVWKQRVILHCDMNNCFASIEAKLNPELRGKPIAVCGRKEERHGIVLAKSEEAKKYGVKTAEAIWQAQQKCPDLIIVPPHFEEYRKHSVAAKKIYLEYTDLVEAFSLDECWLDVTGSQLLFGDGEQIAQQIRRRIKRELGITVSIGVSFNKVFAKLGSDLKKPDAVTVIPPHGYQSIVNPLPVSDLLGVGKQTAQKLLTYNIRTIGDLARTSQIWMQKHFGKQGEMLWYYANGLDHSAVLPADHVTIPKSIGRGVTCPRDIYKQDEIWQVLYKLSDEIAMQLKTEHMVSYGVQLVVRNDLLVDRQTQKTYPSPIHNAKELAQHARELFLTIYRYGLPVRALTVRAISLMEDTTPEQVLLGEDMAKRQKSEKKEQVMYELRKRFGQNSVTAATLTQKPGGKSIPTSDDNTLRKE